MGTKHHTRIAIELDNIGAPDYVIRLDGHIATTRITKDLSKGSHVLEIEHKNKDESDPYTALIIKSITFNDITNPKFVWRGIYTPDYPLTWYNEQLVKPPQELTNHNYLGWNGVWVLEFTAPIFTWIHQVENLGWIYD